MLEQSSSASSGPQVRGGCRPTEVGRLFTSTSTTRFQLLNLTAVLRLDFFVDLCCVCIADFWWKTSLGQMSELLYWLESCCSLCLNQSQFSPLWCSLMRKPWGKHWHQFWLHDPHLEMRQDEDGRCRWPSHTSNFNRTTNTCTRYYMWRNANIHSIVLHCLLHDGEFGFLLTSWCFSAIICML